MRNFNNIIYIIGVILCFIGFIMYNFCISNDRELFISAFCIGGGVVALLSSYL